MSADGAGSVLDTIRVTDVFAGGSTAVNLPLQRVNGVKQRHVADPTNVQVDGADSSGRRPLGVSRSGMALGYLVLHGLSGGGQEWYVIQYYLMEGVRSCP